MLLFCSLKPATSYLHSAEGVGERWKKGEGQKGPWSGFEGSLIPPSQLKIPSWMVLCWDTDRNILQIHPSCPFWRGRPCFYYSFQTCQLSWWCWPPNFLLLTTFQTWIMYGVKSLDIFSTFIMKVSQRYLRKKKKRDSCHNCYAPDENYKLEIYQK